MKDLICMIEKKNKIKIAIIVCGLIALVSAFVFWFLTDNSVNTAGHCAAFLSTVLFAIICIKFVIAWVDSLYENYTKTPTCKSSSSRNLIIIFISFLLIDIVFLSIIHLIRVYGYNDTTTFVEGLKLFLHIDTGYYLRIAEQWYTTSPDYIYDLVFFPAYPLLIKTVNILFNNYLLSAIVVASLFYAGSACLLYKLLHLDYEDRECFRGLKYLAVLPASFFFAAPMSESMFLFFSILCIYFLRNDRWMLAAICGAVTAFTRSLGVVIIVPMLVISITEIIKGTGNRKLWIRRAFQSLIVLTGTVAYLLINKAVTGDAFMFSKLQMDKWGQSIGLFFDTTAFQIDNALADITQPYFTSALGIWFPNVAYCFAVLIIMVFSSNKIRTEYTIWFICYYAIAIGATYLISAPRYLVACLPIYPAIVEVTRNKKVDRFLSVVCILFGLYYLFAFAARWEVF